MKEQLGQYFKEAFGLEARHYFFAPGRVNLIGEHIDYNGGLVMPCAIALGTWLIATPNTGGSFRFRSTTFNDQLDIPLQPAYQKEGKEWYYYPLGVIHHFLQAGKKLKGLDILYHGNLPIAAGLSSSASIEVVTAFALNELFKGGFSKLDIVKLSKAVENQFIGVNSGIMDQFAVTFGEKNKALKLDCKSLEYEAVNCDLGDYLLAIINTNKPRKLAESKYNERVEECTKALKSLQEELPISNLCDIDSQTFERYKYLIDDKTISKRAKHVIEENDRVKQAAEALAANQLPGFGKLMYASHQSLKELYEVSGKELDTIVEFCLNYPDVAGARMTGAGFGGCAIALVRKEAMSDFTAQITAYYTDKIGYAPTVYSSTIEAGVRRL